MAIKTWIKKFENTKILAYEHKEPIKFLVDKVTQPRMNLNMHKEILLNY